MRRRRSFRGRFRARRGRRVFGRRRRAPRRIGFRM